MAHHLSVLALLAVLGLGLGLRLNNLVPSQRGLNYAADTDEGIYAASARLALNGYLPYRDYFCSAPPMALYMFMAILAPTSQPWGDSGGFMALRYTSVIYGMVTLLAIYATATHLGGRTAGLLAALLLAMEGWGVAQDRRAMLEAPMNMFSALAILALVVALQRQSRSLRWYALSGVLAALAILNKTQGMVILLVLLLALLLQRRWRPLVALACAAAAAYLLLSLPYLLTAGDDFVRQLIIFQFLRPPNGDPAIMLRVNAIRNYPEAWLTVRLGLFGAGLLVVSWLWSFVRSATSRDVAPGDSRRQESSHSTGIWLPVLLWAIVVAASFAASKTFYLYYYAQLAVPLALLGGSLLHPWSSQRPRMAFGNIDLKRLADPRLLIVLIILALAAWRGPTELRATVQGTRWGKTAYANIGQYLAANTPANARVLAFEPNYAFLGSRSLSRLADGTFLVDAHAYMLYLSLVLLPYFTNCLRSAIIEPLSIIRRQGYGGYRPMGGRLRRLSCALR